MQQKILWAEVQKKTGRWKSWWTVWDLLADRRCGRAVLDFLTSADVGRLVPQEEETDAVRCRRKSRGRRLRNREGATTVPSHAGLHGVRSRVVEGRARFSMASITLVCLLLSFVCSRFPLSGLGGGQRKACDVPPPRGLRTGKLGHICRSYASMNTVLSHVRGTPKYSPNR